MKLIGQNFLLKDGKLSCELNSVFDYPVKSPLVHSGGGFSPDRTIL
jgi:hypothetical protein